MTNRFMPNCDKKISIAILAGGRSTRMQGQDKGLVPFRGQPLIMNLYRQISSFSDDILINANRNQATYQQLLPACRIISDQWPGFKGPLAGMHSALVHAQHNHVLMVPCDLSLFPKDCIAQLWQAITQQNTQIAYASFNQQALYPLCLVHRSLHHHLEHRLSNGQHAVKYWLFEQQAAVVEFATNNILPINLNTLEDVRLAEQCYASEIANFSNHFDSGAQQ